MSSTAVEEPPAVSNGKGDAAAAKAAVAQVDLPSALKAMNAAIDENKDEVVESDEVVDAIWLALASRTHYWCVGEGGSGKTFAQERAGKRVDVTQFYIQCRADMKREEVFGPLSMVDLQRDIYRHVTDGYLPWARWAALDEIKDAQRFLRQLLNILNERWMTNGGARMIVPLDSAGGMTNFWPEEPELAALFDRFAQRMEQKPVATSRGFKKILRAQLARDRGVPPKLTVVTGDQLDAIQHAVTVCKVEDAIVDAVDKLRQAASKEKLTMSPRRWGEGIKLAKANAVVFGGRDHVIEDDLRVFMRVLPNHPDDFKDARDLCKGFRDKFTEAVEEARSGLNEIKAKVQPQMDAVAGGGSADMNELTNVSKGLKLLKQRIADAKAEHKGRDLAPIERVVAELADIEQFLHRAVLGG